ncbi:MAG: NAD-binding protein [Bacteroidetes bacterium]|nr:NAD-binding protein [Bacteroidota bacterium]
MKATLKERTRYYFENVMSKGPMSLIKWLAVISLLVILVCAVIIIAFGIKSSPDAEGPLDFIEGAWQSLMATLDSGTMGGDEGWSFRMVRFIATIAGIFLISILIGSISSGIDEKLGELRKGRSRVLESNHTLILGWSEKVFSIIRELVEANSNQRKPSIVILADRDKVEMEDEIRNKVEHFGNTRIICRSGSPLESSDITVVNPNEARSIIVLAPEHENSDTHVIKSVLALTNGKNRRQEPYHIVAEIKDPGNMEAAELVGNNEAVYVLSAELISRVTAQTCRQSGLSIVYSDLLQFEGDEIYFQHEPALEGKTYKEALHAYEDSAIIGVYTHAGKVMINPPMDTVFGKNDQVIAISEDDDTVVMNGKKPSQFDATLFHAGSATVSKTESTLILGWNARGKRILEELDNYVPEGSRVSVMAISDTVEADVAYLQQSLKRQRITYYRGDINDRRTLQEIHPETFDHIILLSYMGDLGVQESDAKTLICLLHLRNLSEQHRKDFNIVSEMLDMRNRELADVAKADDFIVSDNLVSLMLSQLSENKALKKVYDILFEAEGSEMYLKPVTNYVKPGVPVDFYTLVESAALKNETAIGYRLISKSNDSASAYGVTVNPAKSEKVTFSEQDKLIVLAED